MPVGDVKIIQRPYVGLTGNVAQRLTTHNSGGSAYTAPHRPWRLVVLWSFQTTRAPSDSSAT